MQGKAELGYRSTGTAHAFLKLSMLQHWLGKCGWCGNSMNGTTSFEIDHVISQENFTQFVSATPELNIYFGVDDVENLAPLCTERKCNQKKGSREDVYKGPIMDMLRLSMGRAEKVRRTVQRMQKATGLEKSMLEILTADLKQEGVNELFKTYGPDLISRLYARQPNIMDSVVSPWDIWQEQRAIPGFYCADDVQLLFSVDLDEAGRVARSVGRGLRKHGVDLGSLLFQGAEEVARRLDETFREGSPAWRPRIQGKSLVFTPEQKRLHFILETDASGVYFDNSGTGNEYYVEGAYEIRVTVRLDGTWATKTKVKGAASVFTPEEWFIDEADWFDEAEVKND